MIGYTTWAAVNRKLDIFLKDDDVEPRYSTVLRIMSWNAAQRVFVSHTPLSKSMRLEIDTGNRTAILPPDFYAIESIYDSDRGIWWRPMRRRPGDVALPDDDLPEYWIWGGRIHLEANVPYDHDDLTMYYWAYYPDVTYVEGDDGSVDVQDDIITIPMWAEPALLHLTAAFVFQPDAIAAADINQWDIKIDSGTPLMNPRAQQAREHLFWYDTIVNRFPQAVVVQQT